MYSVSEIQTMKIRSNTRHKASTVAHGVDDHALRGVVDVPPRPRAVGQQHGDEGPGLFCIGSVRPV